MKLSELETKADEVLTAAKEEKAIKRIILYKERIKNTEKAIEEMKKKYTELLDSDTDDTPLNDFVY